MWLHSRKCDSHQTVLYRIAEFTTPSWESRNAADVKTLKAQALPAELLTRASVVNRRCITDVMQASQQTLIQYHNEWNVYAHNALTPCRCTAVEICKWIQTLLQFFCFLCWRAKCASHGNLLIQTHGLQEKTLTFTVKQTQMVLENVHYKSYIMCYIIFNFSKVISPSD